MLPIFSGEIYEFGKGGLYGLQVGEVVEVVLPYVKPRLPWGIGSKSCPHTRRPRRQDTRSCPPEIPPDGRKLPPHKAGGVAPGLEQDLGDEEVVVVLPWVPAMATG
jgi:hypothetical protein